MRSHKLWCLIGFFGYSFLRCRWEKRVVLVKPNTKPLTVAIRAQSTWLILGTTLMTIINRATGGKKSWPLSAWRGKERPVVQQRGNKQEYNITSPLQFSVMNKIYSILLKKKNIICTNYLIYCSLEFMKLKVQTQFSDPKLDRLKNREKPSKYFLTLRSEIVKKDYFTVP